MTRGRARARATRGPLPVRRGVISSISSIHSKPRVQVWILKGLLFCVFLLSVVRISVFCERERERERVWCVRNIFPPSIQPIIATTSEVCPFDLGENAPGSFRELRAIATQKKTTVFLIYSHLSVRIFLPGFRSFHRLVKVFSRSEEACCALSTPFCGTP